MLKVIFGILIFWGLIFWAWSTYSARKEMKRIAGLADVIAKLKEEEDRAKVLDVRERVVEQIDQNDKREISILNKEGNDNASATE